MERIILGLDIGIASVGWAVISNDRIMDIGVRCFDLAENAKNGESLNLSRRMARLTRRRIRRRTWRLSKLSRLLYQHGLIDTPHHFKKTIEIGQQYSNPWQLRVSGLDRKLEAAEWAAVLYHICKHRGFHWQNKAEAIAAEKDQEGGRVKQGLTVTQELMREKNYRSSAEMILGEFWQPVRNQQGEVISAGGGNRLYQGAARNKRGEYSKALSRTLISEEVQLLFRRQREFGNPFTSVALELQILGEGDQKNGLFWEQKPSLSGQDLLKMLGKCRFERDQYRAAKASYSAERHVLLTRINNLRLIKSGEMRPLSNNERQIALSIPYQQTSGLTYKQLAGALVKAGYIEESEYRFSGLIYPGAADNNAKNPESQILVKVPAWHQMKKCMVDAGLENLWKKISLDALEGDPETLDQIAQILSVYKDDNEVAEQLGYLNLPGAEKTVKALLLLRFDKFSHLSLKALRKIVPYMECGEKYDKACKAAGYHHSLPEPQSRKKRYLPSFYTGRDSNGTMKLNDDLDPPRNPVVLRALNQARKVVNAVIRQYGSPHSIHIEMARDLSRSFDERKKIQKAQEEYRDITQKERQQFQEEYDLVGSVKAKDLEKWQLYREQSGKCAYSLQPIDFNRLLEIGYLEVDHILPYSRSFDDSKNNKVLILTSENRNKANQTPYEYLDGKSDSQRWQLFEAYVNSNKAFRQAKRNRLLKRNFNSDEAEAFRSRHLNDTRYISRFFKSFVENNLQLNENSTEKRCVVVNGQLTAFLRRHWGFSKNRNENDRHHAMDAAIVAACTHSMIKRLSDYARREELENARNVVDAETGHIVDKKLLSQLESHFPSPWPHFYDELEARAKIDDQDQLTKALEKLGTYKPQDLISVTPLFISRAVKRRGSGAAHKDTIYGQTELLKLSGSVKQKIDVLSLKVSDIDKLIDPHRNIKFYAYLRQWVEQRDDHANQVKALRKLAQSESRELTESEQQEIDRLTALPRKLDKNGHPTGPIVRTVTQVIDKLSGIEVRGGVAKNENMIRVDVFEKGGKHYLVPVYVHHLVAQELPNYAAKANKPRDQWDLIDETYTFRFTLYPNDLVHLKTKKAEYFGYFSGMGITNASLSIKSHDRNSAIATGKKWQGTWVNLGVKTGVEVFDKYHVDILGKYYKADQEDRHGLA